MQAVLFKPTYWPIWLLLGGARLLIYLPYSTQLWLGRGLGKLAYHSMRRRRAVAQTNIALCFPNWSEPARAQLLRQHFASLGIGLLEIANSWWASDTQLKDRVQIAGLEHLTQALAQGKGVLLLSAHFTTLEIGGRFLALSAPFHVVYRAHENPVVETAMRRAREHNFDKAIPRGDIRGLIRSLKNDMPVWYAVDQNYGHKDSVFAPFFGIPAATTTATSRLAKMTGAQVVPFFQVRLPDAQGYRIELLPALQDFPSADWAADTCRINALIEQQVRKAPEQYLWVHRRFKDRPDAQARYY